MELLQVIINSYQKRKDLIAAKYQFLLFLIVGGLNTIFGYSMFALLIFLGMHYVLASLLATVLGILFNFKTIGTIVFRSKRDGLILKFFVVYLLSYCINIILLKVFLSFRVNIYLAGAIITILMAFPVFLLNKKFVFRVGE